MLRMKLFYKVFLISVYDIVFMVDYEWVKEKKNKFDYWLVYNLMWFKFLFY